MKGLQHTVVTISQYSLPCQNQLCLHHADCGITDISYTAPLFIFICSITAFQMILYLDWKQH